jgi:hypothetical protein
MGEPWLLQRNEPTWPPNYVPKILPLPLAYVKNGDQQFWKEKFHAANGKAQHVLTNDQFFSFWRGEAGIFFPLFPSAFPDMFPIAPGFYHIWFAPKFNSPCIWSKMVKSRGAHLFIVCNWGSYLLTYLQFSVIKWIQRGASIGDMPNVPKQLLMGQSTWLLFKKRKSCEPTHDLINMNHTIHYFTNL